MTKKEKVFGVLDELKISYQVTHHKAVYTIDELDSLGMEHMGNVVKNLFLRDGNGKRHFIVVLAKDKKADLKLLRAQLNSTALSFASEERLEKYLNLEKGAVTPLGIINDESGSVEVVFDADLVEEPSLGVHPNDNSATVWISFEGLKKVIEHKGNKIHYINIIK